MFGKKAAEIARLRQAASACEAHRPFVPLAEEISARVKALNIAAGPELENQLAHITAELARDERMQFLAELLDGLCSSDRLALLSRVYDNATLHEAYEKQYQTELAISQTERHIGRLAQEAASMRGVDLRRIPNPLVVDITMSIASGTEERYIRAASVGEGLFSIIGDRDGQGEASGGQPYISMQEVVALGATRDLDTQMVYLAGSLSCRIGDQYHVFEDAACNVFMVHEVRVNGKPLLDDY